SAGEAPPQAPAANEIPMRRRIRPALFMASIYDPGARDFPGRRGRKKRDSVHVDRTPNPEDTQMVALPLPPREPTLGDVDALCAASLAPDAFVDALQRAALGSRAVAHPLLQDIADGRFGDLAGAIRRLLGEYYVYSHRFTRYLAATMATLDAP